MIERRFSRRYFFYGSLLAGAVPSGGFGSTPSLAALGYKSFTEKLNIAAVGVGMRGNQILVGAAASENIVALCDVDDDRLARASQPYPKAAKYKDFRKMLDKEGKNIDAVMVATPDHLHTAVSLLCMQHRNSRSRRSTSSGWRSEPSPSRCPASCCGTRRICDSATAQRRTSTSHPSFARAGR